MDKENNNGFFNFAISWFSKKQEQKEKINDEDDFLKYSKYIEDFIDILKENNLNESSIDQKEKIKIIEYAKKYLKIEKNIKELKDYKDSLYEDFKFKFMELMKNAQDSLNIIFNKYVADFLMKTHSVICIVNSKFEMNKEEFEKKYSEEERIKYLEKNKINL